jgi:nitrite reductase/ring-hydroxylating ferredoxin subunit
VKNSVASENRSSCAGAAEPQPVESTEDSEHRRNARCRAAPSTVEIFTRYQAEQERGSLCRLDELPPGVARGFDPDSQGDDRLIAVRYGDELRVYRNDCPHQHRPMGWRKDRFLSADGRFLVCFAHGARFDIGSGLCVDGPCLGEFLERVPHRMNARGICEFGGVPDGRATVTVTACSPVPQSEAIRLGK